VAGGAFTAIEPSSDTPCRFPGTAASAPAARQLRHAYRPFPGGLRAVWPVPPGPPDAAPVKVQQPKTRSAFRRVFGLGSALRQRLNHRFALRAPLRHLPARTRVSEALVSFRLARPPPARLAAHRDGRRRMRPTDFCFPSLCRREPAPRLFPTLRPVLPGASGERDTSRYPARFSGPRALFRCGVFLPRAETLDRASDTPVALRASAWRVALFLRRCAHALEGPRPTPPRSPWRDRSILDPRCLPSPSAEPSTRAPTQVPTTSRDSRFRRSRGFALPRSGSRRPFAHDDAAPRSRDRRTSTAC